jgi:molecular chaperone GrpE
MNFARSAIAITVLFQLFPYPNYNFLIFAMFQRTLLRQAQAARSVLATSSSTSASLALRRTTRLQQQLPAAIRPFAQPTRFYSTEKEASKEGESESAEQNPLEKELEAKNKEVIDLKV